MSLRSSSRYTQFPTDYLCGVEECRVDAFQHRLFAEIRCMLTTDAQRGPRHRLKAPPANPAVAMHAHSVRAVFNSEQRRLYASASVRFTVQAGNRQFPASLVVSLLEHIGASFRSRCSRGLAPWRVQRGLPLRCSGILPDRAVSYYSSSPPIISCHIRGKSRQCATIIHAADLT